MLISDWSSDVCSSDLASGCLSAGGVVSPGAVHQVADAQPPQPGAGFHPVHLPSGCADLWRDVADDLSRAATELPTTSDGTDRSGRRAASTDPGFRGGAIPVPEMGRCPIRVRGRPRSEEHTSELQSLMRLSYDVY